LKLQKWEDAELDCTVGLKLHPDNSKALWRRGIARRELGKLEEAKKDIQDALRLEPNDKAVKEELDKVLSAIESSAIESATPTKTDTDQTNGVLRRRLSIEEVDFDEDDIESKKIDPIKTNEKIVKNNKLVENPVISPKKSTVKNFRAPQSVIEFERDWTIQQNDEDLYHYIKVIPPSSYPSLLSNLLEADYISRILIILKDFYLVHDTVVDIYDILYNLSLVERFSLVVGFLGKEDKKILEILFKTLSKDTQIGVGNLEKLTRENVLGLAKVYHIQDLE
jgi:tetratricopeptide (TPR) repeat protein